ncbi:PREDICTED: myomesin-1, partial [Tinamus guttatus]|uniref:myomesin-1 n=1 Tax=Tinamus guttatus TaxID=94827 RepID=UPI00052F32EF
CWDTDKVHISFVSLSCVAIPLVSELAVEILEKGEVRFWLQAEKLSGNAKANFVFNDKEIFNGEKYKTKVDQKTGLVEMIMDKLEEKDEGTYTFQLQDGKATNQSSLVLIGDVFKKLQDEANFQRKEWQRKQGPHFVEYLGWEVTDDCNVLLKCKVANIKKETHIVWYKDDREIMVDEEHDFKDGVCTLLISEFSKKDAGIYEVILKDDRGKDSSELKLMNAAFADLMNEVCRRIALSATDLKIQSTAEGIRLYSFVNYYVEDLRVGWVHNDTQIRFTDRVKTGVTGEQIWLQINEPTPQDKGKYTMELFDGKTGHKKTVDLSGQAFDEAFAEFQRLKQAAIAEKNRARVLGGLPDVVTIQEGKALNLSCTVWGDPTPEVSWLKNEKSFVSDANCVLKYESGKNVSFSISAVSTHDSGKYSVVVKNKYGTETSDVTVIVISMSEQTDMAKYAASAQGHKPNNITVAKKKRSTNLIKPRVEEIIATEETPGPNEIGSVETKQDTENNQRGAKETKGKTTGQRDPFGTLSSSAALHMLGLSPFCSPCHLLAPGLSDTDTVASTDSLTAHTNISRIKSPTQAMILARLAILASYQEAWKPILAMSKRRLVKHLLMSDKEWKNVVHMRLDLQRAKLSILTLW